MASCFLCGIPIRKGTEVRRLVYSGSSIAGFNITSHFLLDAIINSAIGRRSPRVRSFYVSRIVCQTCNREANSKLFRRIILTVSIALLVILGAAAILAIAR
jgi:hypothetical protein